MTRTMTLMRPLIGVLALAAVLALGRPVSATEYNVDSDHASTAFRINHMGLSWVYGIFQQTAGKIVWDEQDLSKASFVLEVQAASINTGVAQRDNHLRTHEFLDVEKYPTIRFQSTAVTAGEDGYTVTGNLTLRGHTKSITVPLAKIGQDQAKGKIGFATEFTLNRHEFGITGFQGLVGDTVHLMISFEGIDPSKVEPQPNAS